MSVILDALKKLDREKSFRKNMAANIAVEILKPDLPRSKKRFPLYLTTILFTAIAAAVITYFTMAGFAPKTLPPEPMNPSTTNQGVTPAPMEHHLPPKSSAPAPLSPSASSQQVKPAIIPREVAQEAQDEIKRKSLPPPTSTEGKITLESKPAATSVEEKKSKPNMIQEEAVVTPSSTKKSHAPTASGFSANPPSLKLSAIVWYEDPSMRFAMVNGIKATEGTIVEGVKVVEINPTSVRFLYNDRYFEISMQK